MLYIVPSTDGCLTNIFFWSVDCFPSINCFSESRTYVMKSSLSSFSLMDCAFVVCRKSLINPLSQLIFCNFFWNLYSCRFYYDIFRFVIYCSYFFFIAWYVDLISSFYLYIFSCSTTICWQNYPFSELPLYHCWNFIDYVVYFPTVCFIDLFFSLIYFFCVVPLLHYPDDSSFIIYYKMSESSQLCQIGLL